MLRMTAPALAVPAGAAARRDESDFQTVASAAELSTLEPIEYCAVPMQAPVSETAMAPVDGVLQIMFFVTDTVSKENTTVVDPVCTPAVADTIFEAPTPRETRTSTAVCDSHTVCSHAETANRRASVELSCLKCWPRTVVTAGELRYAFRETSSGSSLDTSNDTASELERVCDPEVTCTLNVLPCPLADRAVN
jgi:hypothetical protein